jgi:hypothetical protein
MRQTRRSRQGLLLAMKTGKMQTAERNGRPLYGGLQITDLHCRYVPIGPRSAVAVLPITVDSPITRMISLGRKLNAGWTIRAEEHG